MTWHFYDPITGRFSGRSYSGDAEHLSANTPQGLNAFHGPADWQHECVDLITGNLIACTPTNEFDNAAAQAFHRVSRQEQISTLEQQQARPLRELMTAQLLGQPIPKDAADRLHAIHAQIEQHRRGA